MKNRLRKSLSVFLSVLMMVTSFSIVFGITSFAAPIDDLATALAQIPTAERNAFTIESTHGDSASGEQTHRIRDNTSNGSIYAAAQKFEVYFRSIIVTGNGTTNNADSPTWWTKIYRRVSQDSRMAPYANLLKAFSDVIAVNGGGDRGNPFKADRNPNGNSKDVPSSGISVTVNVVRSELQALKVYADIASMPNSVDVSLSYGANGARQCTSSSSDSARNNYFSGVKATTSSSANAIVTKLKQIDNYFTPSRLTHDPVNFTSEELSTEITNNNYIISVLNGLLAEERNTFFTTQKLNDIADYAQRCEDVYSMLVYTPDVEYFHNPGGFIDTINAGYDTNDLAAMEALWNEQAYYYNRLASATEYLRSLLTANLGLDMPAIEAARATLLHDIHFIHLNNLKTSIDAIYGEYHRANEDYSDAEEFTDALLQHINSELLALFAQVNTKSSTAIALVFTDGTGYVSDFIAELQYEMTHRDIANTYYVHGHRVFFLEIENADYSRTSSSAIMSKINEANGRLPSLQADLAVAAAELRPADFEFLYSGLVELADSSILRLYQVLEATVTAQVQTAKDSYVDYGAVTWDNFALIKSFINLIDKDAYEFLEGTSYMSAQTRADYEWLNAAVIAEYYAFIQDGGYANFVQLELEPYPIRSAMLEDLARTVDFGVTEEQLVNVLQSLDKMLTSEAFTDLTDMDLSSCVLGLTSSLCSDSTVNCIAQILYPAVLEALEDAWSDLPTTYNEGDAKLNINVETLHSVLAKDTSTNTIKNLALYPDLLAKLLPNEFATVKADMIAAMNGVNLVVSPTRPNTDAWASLEDEDGDLIIDWGVETPFAGTIMEDMTQAERFRHAISNMLKGVYPLLSALLLGQGYASHADKVASGSGTYKILFEVSIKADPIYLDLTATGNHGYAKVLTPIFEALNGEDLSSIPTAAQLASYTSPFQLYDAIANPIYSFLDKLATAPLNKIVELLPNIAHAMSFDNVAPLLNELSVDVTYSPDGQVVAAGFVNCTLSNVADLSDSISLNVGELLLGDPESSPIDLSCTTDLNAFIQKAPACLSSFGGDDDDDDDDDGCTLALPTINAGRCARLGTMPGNSPTHRVAGTSAGGCTANRHYIYADKADVLYGLLKYLLAGLRNDPVMLESIMGLFDSDDDDDDEPGEPGEPGEPTCPCGDDCPLGDDCPCRAGGTGDSMMMSGFGGIGIMNDDEESSTLLDIIAIISAEENEDNTIAALVEVFNQVKYDVPEHQWRTPDDTATIPYLVYINNWTYPTANYIATNIDTIVLDVMELLGEEGSLGDIIEDALDGVFTQDIIKKLTDKLADLDLDDTILDLVASLGADLSAWNKYIAPKNPCPCPCWGPEISQEDFYYYEFEDGDREAFLAALYDIFTPVASVLEFLLNGNDLSAFDGAIKLLGYDGYADGIIPLLEALSCEDIMTGADYKAAIAAGDSTVVLSAILDPIFGKIDALIANPVSTILDMLPNLLYFLSSDGLSTTLNIILHPLFVVLDTIRPIYPLGFADILGLLSDDLPAELTNVSQISDLTLPKILDIVEELVELDIAGPIMSVTDNLVGYATPFTSANGKAAYAVTDMDRADVITFLISVVLGILDDDNNVEALTDMIGEDTFTAIKNVLHLDEMEAEAVHINWLYQDEYALDPDKVYNALNTSVMFDEAAYGRLWTPKTAKYVDENLNTVVDRIIYLLGVEVDGERMKDLDDFVLNFVGTSLYTQDNALALLDMIKELIEEIDELGDAAVHIKALLKESFDIDLDYWANFDESTINVPDNNKAAFIDAVNTILLPLNPLLSWLLRDKDFAFFVDEEQKDAIVLPGAEGYEYGIIPILEIFECEGIMEAVDFNSDEEENNIITNIITPLLNKVDVILEDPLNELLNVLPALTYFINSGGLDVSFKNLIMPLRTVLTAIDPIATVDLYDVLGFRLDEYDMEALLDMLLEELEDSTGASLSPIVFDAVAEMTMGKIVEKDSLSRMNGNKRLTMEYAGPDRSDTITMLMRLVIRFITEDDNPEVIKELLRENVDMDETSYGYVASVIDAMASALEHPHGMDTALGAFYYMVYGLDVGTGELLDLYGTLNKAWSAAFNALLGVNPEFYDDAVKFLEEYLPGIISPGGILAPDGFMAFFQRIAEFFQKIIDFINGFFS